MPIQYELNIRDYIRIVKKRKWIIIISTLSSLLFTYLYTRTLKPVYSASILLKIEQRVTTSGILTEWVTWNPGEVMSTETKIIKSQLIARKVAEKLNLLKPGISKEEEFIIVNDILSKIDAQREGDSNMIRISVLSSIPSETVLLANTVGQIYIERTNEDRNKRTKDVREFIGSQLSETKSLLNRNENNLKIFKEKGIATGRGEELALKQIDLKSKLKQMEGVYTQSHPEIKKIKEEISMIEAEIKKLPSEDIELSRLIRELKANEELYNMMNKKFKEAMINEADRVEPVSIVNEPVLPVSPISPNKRLNMIIGGFLGLFVGFVLSFISESLDTSIGAIEDVEKYIELPVLGVISHISIKGFDSSKSFFKFGKNKENKIDIIRNRLIFFHDLKSPVIETYHTLRTNIKFSSVNMKLKKIIITSAGPEEGKSLTAANFAIVCAQTGLKVLLIEADFRKPMIDKLFGLKREPGLSELIIGQYSFKDVVRSTSDFIFGELSFEKLIKVPGIDNLKILTCGHLPPNPIDLLSSKHFSNLISEVENEFDYIIFDCPPVLMVADSMLIGPIADGLIFVYKVGATARGALKRAKTQIDNAKIKILGVVLNDLRAAEMEPTYGYYYSSYKYYGEKKS